MPEQPTHITVTVDDIEDALREWLAHFEYDLHKGLECGEEDGLDRYPEEAAAFFSYLVPSGTETEENDESEDAEQAGDDGALDEANPVPQCTAGLMPAGSEPVDRCVRHGKHDSHVTASGARWGDGSADA